MHELWIIYKCICHESILIHVPEVSSFLYLRGNPPTNTDCKGLGYSRSCLKLARTDSTNPGGSCSGDVDKYCKEKFEGYNYESTAKY